MTTYACDVAILIDASHSMQHFVSYYTSAVNKLLDVHSKKHPDAKVTIALFNTELTYCFLNANIRQVVFKHRVRNETTALFDCFDKFVRDILICKYHENRKTIFLIITDGEDNSSASNTERTNKILINKTEKEQPWLFVYLGTDGVQCLTGEKMGSRHSILYSQTMRSIDSAFQQVFNLIEGNFVLHDVSEDVLKKLEELSLD